jgi:hypothetical protein
MFTHPHTHIYTPKFAGVIREEGGKMLMLQRRWSEAYPEFNEAFRAYQARASLFG